MRTPRIILDDGACAYHCISRVVGQEKLFTDAIKEKIQEIIINAAHLHGIHLINWTILSNHIHILAVVPGSDLKVPLSKSSLLKAVNALYSESYLTDLKQQFKRAEKLDAAAEGQQAVQRILDRYETNRGNLSEFMKEVKQRTSLYVNKRLKRYGTLWDGRFKSPIVENTAEAREICRRHQTAWKLGIIAMFRAISTKLCIITMRHQRHSAMIFTTNSWREWRRF